MNLHYDEKQNKESLYQLWQEVFHDPKSFAEYYFAEKYKENQVLLAEKERKVIGMIHLNPYKLEIEGNSYPAAYIIGVATLHEYRRQGIMRAMLERVMVDLKNQGHLFTYLMPADPAYYLPFDFAFVYDRYQLQRESAKGKNFDFRAEGLQENNEQELSAFWEVNKKQFQITAKRDKNYWHVLRKELACEDGEVILLYERAKLIGFFSYARDKEKVYVREVIATKATDQILDFITGYFAPMDIEFTLDWFHNIEGTVRTPSIMFRILNVNKLIPLMKSKVDQMVRIRIEDPILADNNLTVLWESNQSGSKITPIESEAEEVLSISELTTILFDYPTGKETQRGEFFQNLIPLNHIFISEIV